MSASEKDSILNCLKTLWVEMGLSKCIVCNYSHSGRRNQNKIKYVSSAGSWELLSSLFNDSHCQHKALSEVAGVITDEALFSPSHLTFDTQLPFSEICIISKNKKLPQYGHCWRYLRCIRVKVYWFLDILGKKRDALNILKHHPTHFWQNETIKALNLQAL